MASSIAKQYAELCGDALFARVFQLVPLPSPDGDHSRMENSNSLEDLYAQLQRLKQELNSVKGRVPAPSDVRWRMHTAWTHPVGGLPDRLREESPHHPSPSLITQAYCKFRELANGPFGLLSHQRPSVDGTETREGDSFRSLHLCEAPGAFVAALHDILEAEKTEKDGMKNLRWEWRMNSLNPNHPENAEKKALTIDTGLLQAYPERMVFGEDGTGDIHRFSTDYIHSLGKFDLVTADGSFDCTDNPGAQELVVRPLLARETEIALACLRPGGNFLLKAFTFFERETVALVTGLMRRFHRVRVVKPPSSKPGNSEVYIVCLNFFGAENLVVQQQPEPTPGELARILACAQFFAQLQRRFIAFNLSTFGKKGRLSPVDTAAIEIQKLAGVERLLAELNTHNRKEQKSAE